MNATNNGENRALVCYLYGSENTELEAFDDTIFDTSFGSDVIDSAIGKITIGEARTVNVALTSGDWSRSLKIGSCVGELLVGVYFFEEQELEPEILVENQEPSDDEFQEDDTELEEPEQVSVPQLICDALQSAFPDGKAGASVFVISPDMSEFELEVE